MKNMHDDMLLVVQQKMQRLTDMPNDRVWERLNDRLNNHRRRIFWSNIAKRGAVAASALLTLLFIVKNISSTNSGANNAKETQVNSIEIPSAKGVTESELPAPKKALNDNSRVVPHGEKVLKNNELLESVDRMGYLTTDKPDANAFVALSQRPDPFPAVVWPQKFIPELKLRFSKSTTQTLKRDRRFFRGASAYLQISPVMNYMIVDGQSNDDVEVTRIESPTILAPERLGMGVEAGFAKTLGRKWSFSAGVAYYRQKIAFDYFTRSPGKFHVVNGENGIELIPDNTETPYTVKHAMANFGADMSVFYLLRGDKLQQKVGGGLTFHQGLLKTDGGYDNSGSSYLHYALMYRFEYSLNRKLKIYIQPRYSRPLFVQENLDHPIRIKTTRAGVSVGAIYNLQID
jgi:hypothetical protein